MLCKIFSATPLGLDGVIVQVEVDVAERGFPTFTIVGLGNKAIEESKERVRAAIKNSSFSMPETRITVNLAPADIPKSGSLFDLPIAIGILAASKMIEKDSFSNSLFVGELSLDGTINSVAGILPIIIAAKKNGIQSVFVPYSNRFEASLVGDITVFPVKNITSLCLHLNKQIQIEAHPYSEFEERNADDDKAFENIIGQEQSKRALEIAAAGFHNIHLCGSPGSGKTMLARSFQSILPPMTKEEALEVAKIYSVVFGLSQGFTTVRPFRSPHHTTSKIGLVGGGSNLLPGEISLAHRGVLFLDEIPEFPRSTLEVLRQPLEDGTITISRAKGSVVFPARFILFAASNPCPSGFFTHPHKQCMCSQNQIQKYKKRLSGPFLDRIDLHITVYPIEQKDFTTVIKKESTSSLKMRIQKAWQTQKDRFKGTSITFNGEMNSQKVREICVLEPEAQNLMQNASSHLQLSARSYFKIIKIAQTIADLDGHNHISSNYIAEALQYRIPE
jgi:magnesium chelatase family protein